MTTWLILLAAGVAVVVTALAWRRRAAVPGVVGPYGEIRRAVIASVSESAAAPPPIPERPAGLDFRLSADVRAELESLWPPNEANWQQYFETYLLVTQSIHAEFAAVDREQSHEWYELLSEARRTLIVVDQFESEVNNGGFDQYFLNTAGDAAGFLPADLRRVGSPEAAALAERAIAEFPGGPARHRAQRLAQMDELPESARAVWSELDDAFFALSLPFGGIAANLGGRLILDHADEFFRPAQ